MVNTFNLKPLKNEMDITKEWLERMLSHKYEAEKTVKKWTTRSSENKMGFLSETFFVEVDIINESGLDDTIHLVFKLFPLDEYMKSIMVRGDMARREVEFYHFTSSHYFKEVCAKSGVSSPVPDVLYADFEGDVCTIVMVDLNTLGYKMVIPIEGIDLPHMCALMKSLAVVHAAGMYFIEKEGKETIDNPFDCSFMDEYIIPNLEKLSQLYEGQARSLNYKALIPLAEAMRNSPAKHPLLETLIHGDLWVANVLFKGEATSMTASLIDWQYAHVNNPVCDVMAMVLLSGRPDDLEHLPYILQVYWSTLTQVLGNVGVSLNITFEKFKSNFEDLWIYGFMFFAVSVFFHIEIGKMNMEKMEKILNFFDKKDILPTFIQENCS